MITANGTPTGPKMIMASGTYSHQVPAGEAAAGLAPVFQ